MQMLGLTATPMPAPPLAALALAGIPPLSGFFSKDAVIAAALSAQGAAWLGPLALAGTLLTGGYMARALCLLWRGSGETRPVAGSAWMRVGIWGLAVPATILGLAFGPIEAVLDLPAVTAGTLAVLLGLLAAACGLGLGWLVPAPRLLGPVYPWARRGLSVGGGLTVWVGRPAMAVARGCERLEGRLYEAVLSLGRAGLFLASAGERAERGLFKIVLCVGRVSLRVATYVRFGDERRIDGLIFALVAAVRALGARARNLQSGLIHHSLAISAVAIAVTLAVLLFASSTSF